MRWPADQRIQALANCSCLYGPGIELVTLHLDNGTYQAVAMRFDPYKNSWTRFLHSRDELASSSDAAIASLLHETATELARLFSLDGASLPLSGPPVQIIWHSAESRDGLSESSSIELIAKPKSISEKGIALKEPFPPETETMLPDGATESSVCKNPLEVQSVEETLGQSSGEIDEYGVCTEFISQTENEIEMVAETYSDEPPPTTLPEHELITPVDDELTTSIDNGWSFWVPHSTDTGKKKGKAKAERVVTSDEMCFEGEPSNTIEPEPKPEPEPQVELEPPNDLDDWGSVFPVSKKDKKRKGKKSHIPMAIIDEPFVEDTPLLESEPAPEPVEFDEWGFGVSSKKDKKKKKTSVTFDEPLVEETPLPEAEPPLEPVEVDEWGFGFSTMKKDKKKKKTSVTFDEPLVEETLLPEAEPAPDPVEVEWGFGFSTKKKDKKKKKTLVRFDEPLVEETPLQESEPPLEPLEDDGWGFGFLKKMNKKKSSVALEEPLIEETPLREAELTPDLVEDDGWGTGSSKKMKKGKKKVYAVEFAKMDPVAENWVPPSQSNADAELCRSLVVEESISSKQLPIETFEAPPEVVVKESSFTAASPPPTVQSDISTSYSLVRTTVVLKIVHTTLAGTETLQTMLNLADNTMVAFSNAINRYLNFNSESRCESYSRIIQIRLASGKNGDLDMSHLDERGLRECLDYLSQYTKFPELTVHVDDESSRISNVG